MARTVRFDALDVQTRAAVTRAEVERLLNTLGVGGWSAREFADDRTGQRWTAKTAQPPSSDW